MVPQANSFLASRFTFCCSDHLLACLPCVICVSPTYGALLHFYPFPSSASFQKPILTAAGLWTAGKVGCSCSTFLQYVMDSLVAIICLRVCFHPLWHHPFTKSYPKATCSPVSFLVIGSGGHSVSSHSVLPSDRHIVGAQ